MKAEPHGAMVGVFVAVAMAGSACGASEVGSSAEGPAAATQRPSSVEGLDLYEDPVADAPSPRKRGAAASRFVNCDHGISNGGWGPDFGAPEEGAPDPEAALSAFLREGLFRLPGDGYSIEGTDHNRVLFTHADDGEAKVAVIVAQADGSVELTVHEGWVVETFASCDPAEFNPAADETLSNDIWTTGDGGRVPTSTVTSFAGPDHCGWETVTFLVLDGRQYVRDPDGVFEPPLVQPYDRDAAVPQDATDTGYSNDGRELWLSDDAAVAYLVTADGAEAWPSTVEETWCR